MKTFFVSFDLVNIFNGSLITHHEETRQADNPELAMIQAHDNLRRSLRIVGKRQNEMLIEKIHN